MGQLHTDSKVLILETTVLTNPIIEQIFEATAFITISNKITC